MKDLRRAAGECWIDHGTLASWVVEFVGGSSFFAAHYYTGVPSNVDEASDRHALVDLLEDLEQKPGFFIHRFVRRSCARECPHCAQLIVYTEEKMVDTSLVTDLVMLAVRDAYDIAVVFSGDADIAPGIHAVHSLGKKVWIATFGEAGLSKTLMRAAWASVDLTEHLDRFSVGELVPPPERVPESEDEIDMQMLRELRRAQAHFISGGGFVGAHYFIHRWKGHRVPEDTELRRQSLQRLLSQQRIETYVSEGKTALRAAEDTEAAPVRPAEPGALSGLTEDWDHGEGVTQVPTVTIRRVVREAPPEEEEGVQLRVSETTKRFRRPVPRGE